MTRILMVLAACALGGVGLFAPAFAEAPAGKQDKLAPAPAQDPAKKDDLEATLVAFKGTVDVKRPEDKDWVAAERNMKLKKGSEVCTAMASSCTLLFGGGVQVDVKALTQAKIEDLAKLGGKINAGVNLKFGTIKVDIQKGDLKADMKVTSPNSTTSVSGSTGIVRAPAQGGGGGIITLRTFSGTWVHESGGAAQGVEGEGVADNQGNRFRDLLYFAGTHDFTDFGGRGRAELYQGPGGGKGGDFNAWDLPFSDFAERSPASKKHKKPSPLPRPPGVP